MPFISILRRSASFDFLLAAILKFTPCPPIRNIKRYVIVNARYFPSSVLLIIRVILTKKDDRFPLVLLDYALLDEIFLLCADAIKKNRSRFIVGIMWNKLTVDGKVKDF